MIIEIEKPGIEECFRENSGIFCDRRGHIVFPREENLIVQDRRATYALARDRKNRVLLAWPRFGNGFADLPGGGAHAGEDWRAALYREWYEETGQCFPFPPGKNPDGRYEQHVNLYAEDANRFIAGYLQNFYLFKCDDRTPDGLLKRDAWYTPEGMASWEPISMLPDVPMNRVHWHAIQKLVPEMQDKSLRPASTHPRTLTLEEFRR